MAGHGLSKSRITAWRQCPKRLWLQVHRHDLIVESEQAARAFRIGHEIGEVAQRLCPGGILIGDNDNLSAAIASTKTAMSAYPDRPLFEATFQHDGLLVRADVLLPTRHGYRMAEVKSSAGMQPYHVEDCAVQAWVFKQNKIKLASVELAYVDTSFVYPGNGNYHGLLQSVRLDDEVDALQGDVPKWVRGARLTLAGKEPGIKPGTQCDEPFECSFKAYCSKGRVQPKEPEYSLNVLYRMSSKTKQELRDSGYHDARKVPAHYLNETQRWIQQVSKSGKPSLNKRAAQQKMASLTYPRYYVDFETIALAVPRWSGTRPYSTQVPFQWSCHIEASPGVLRNEMFLDVSGNDPRRGFAESLIRTVGKKGAVLVYNQQFEKGRIEELALQFPDLTGALRRINDRVVDLLPIARQHYYHPDMKGSWSIKAVLPTIAPELAYDSLEVGNGQDAQNAYSDIVQADTKIERKQALIDGLREYCERDTLAMVRLAWFLESRAIGKMSKAR